MRRWIGLLFICVLPSIAEAATYYADPAGGGAASCVDNTANVCTLARAEAVATNGDTVVAACGTYDLGSTSLTINVNIEIKPVTPLCATITGSNATAPVVITVADNAAILTFGEFIVAPTGSASRGISISDVAYSRTLLVRGTQPLAGVNSAINSLWLRGTERYEGLIAAGTMGAQGWIRIQGMAPAASKTVVIDGVTGTWTAGASGEIAIWIERSTTTPQPMYVAVRNVNVSMVLPASLGSAASIYGIYVKNVSSGPDLTGTTANSVVENNTLSINAPAVFTGGVEGIYVFATNATANGNGFIVRNNSVTSNAPAGGLVRMGANTALTSYHDGGVMYGNVAECVNAPDGVSTPHGLVIGNVTNARAWGNIIRGCAAPILSSINTNVTFTGNITIGAPYVGLFAKGNTSATFSNNTVILDDSLYQPKFGGYGCWGVAIQNAVNNTDTTFINNNCVIQSGTAWKYLVVDASQVAHFDGNNYVSLVTLTNPWSYQGTTYASLALWNAAATVGTELNVDPLFISKNDLRLQASSTLRRAGVGGYPCSDFRGRICWSPPDIGAYQATSGDQAVTRLPRN